ncbi:PREDICTED: zinc finger protein 786 isoform X2 [Ceratotherium simum simum]|uniref:Zinc finger protein 786 isoform X2 n=1 Tax=Ceratotherium simum simum TaxID=73337 RepID=A0ABM1CUB4_CERSS|nr:PREDICTED: zinc finger protein 786 isoform X2 [Ceratotherium simum simum]
MGEPPPLPLTFEDVAVYFSEQEWQKLEAWQKELYKHVMRTNYEILVSLDDGLPKPELISWMEQGRELFRNWGESQKSGNIICSSADLHFDPVIEGQLFWVSGSQQAVNSGKTKCHFQVDPLQSQCSSEPLLGKSEDISFMPDQGLTLTNPHRHDTCALIPVVHSCREPTQRERIPSPRTLGLPGFQEIPSCEATQYPCPACGESFWKKNHLEKHQRSHLKDQPRRAWKKFSRQADPQHQRSIPRGQRHFRCQECGRSFRLKQYLLRHLATHAEKSPLQCPECKICFRHKQALLSHHLLHKGERPPQCPTCDKSFLLKNSMPAHQGHHSGEGPVSCRVGEEEAELTSVHSGEKPGLCLACGEHCHLKGVEEAFQCGPAGERPFVCTECGKRFPAGSRLASHARVHTGEKPLQCPQCDKSFHLSSLLQVHQRVHSGERPFSCSECGRGFTHQCKLREHLRVHSGERPFQCPECDKSFRLKGILKAHQRTHSKERPFSCGECGKGFTRQSKLTEHFRVHSGERPFQCPDCDRSFRLKAQLLSHQGLHTGERPFHCPECDKNFREKGHMLRHQRIHRPERPFACGDCGKGFIYKSKLAEHLRVHTKSYNAPNKPDIKKRLSQLFAMIEADWS